MARAEAALFRHRAGQGAPWENLVPQWHPAHLEQFAPVVQAYQGRIHVLPSYFAAGAHLYDMAGSLYLGYSIRGDSLRSQEAERARAVAMLAYLAQIPVSVSGLAAVLGVSQPTVSQHLQLLRNAGLVSQHREGNKVYYHTEPEALAEALEQTRRTILH